MNPLRTPDADERLIIYLNDHHAAIVGEFALAQRCRGSNTGTSLGHDLTLYIGDVTADRDTIERLIDELGGSIDQLKGAAAIVAERLGRFKTNGQLVGSSPLSTVVELEGLITAAQLRSTMWQVLDHHDLTSTLGADQTRTGRAGAVDDQIARLREHLFATTAAALLVDQSDT